MYAEKYFNGYFYEQIVFEIFVTKRDTGYFFQELIVHVVKL